jgi:hypothetical protein
VSPRRNQPGRSGERSYRRNGHKTGGGQQVYQSDTPDWLSLDPTDDTEPDGNQHAREW